MTHRKYCQKNEISFRRMTTYVISQEPSKSSGFAQNKVAIRQNCYYTD